MALGRKCEMLAFNRILFKLYYTVRRDGVSSVLEKLMGKSGIGVNGAVTCAGGIPLCWCFCAKNVLTLTYFFLWLLLDLMQAPLTWQYSPEGLTETVLWGGFSLKKDHTHGVDGLPRATKWAGGDDIERRDMRSKQVLCFTEWPPEPL